jgi:hypothetical protein
MTFARSMTFTAIAALMVAPAVAQTPEKLKKLEAEPLLTGKCWMKAKIGSFKITSPGDPRAYGDIKMSFKGSVLIVNYEGKTPIVATGNLRKEYENKDRNRVMYFGQGTITLNGRMRAMQWFGTDLDMTWKGMGICRLQGKFDKDGNTGQYFLEGEKQPFWWPADSTLTFVLPRREDTIVAPKVKINPPSGG